MKIQDYFKENGRLALAFSGGTDSAYLLYSAVSAGADMRAYYVRSPFQPRFEYDDALRLAHELGAGLSVIELDILSCSEIAENSDLRCYHCKNRIMSAIIARAHEDGYALIADGTNADDSFDERPGMRALSELGVVSPLRECGLTKRDIRSLSKAAGLFTWDKPAYACLATRIPTGERISREKLELIEKSENFLSELGFKDFRLRLRGENALLQLTRAELSRARESMELIRSGLGGLFTEITIDPTPRKSSVDDNI